METLDEWNVELVLVNSHDAGCAYQLHAGIYRRVCSNGLVLSEGSFTAIRFRHSGLEPEEVVHASLRLIEFMPRIGELVQKLRNRVLDVRESMHFAEQALRLRYLPDCEVTMKVTRLRGLCRSYNPQLFLPPSTAGEQNDHLSFSDDQPTIKPG